MGPRRSGRAPEAQVNVGSNARWRVGTEPTMGKVVDTAFSQSLSAQTPAAWRTTKGAELSEETVARLDGWWRAANYLSVGQIYLLTIRCCAPALPGPRQTPPARSLGHDARAELPLRAPQPGHRRACAVDHLRHRSGPRRSRPGGQRVPGRHLLGGLLRDHSGRRRHQPAVQAVLVPRRASVARRAGDARVDPRGRRTRLRPVPRVRRRVRQPQPVVAAVVGDGEAETEALATSWHSTSS